MTENHPDARGNVGATDAAKVEKPFPRWFQYRWNANDILRFNSIDDMQVCKNGVHWSFDEVTKPVYHWQEIHDPTKNEQGVSIEIIAPLPATVKESQTVQALRDQLAAVTAERDAYAAELDRQSHRARILGDIETAERIEKSIGAADRKDGAA